jgi:NAD(P)-dependent dehydrogenase (short-subunit alcohol dehydrogenase family)
MDGQVALITGAGQGIGAATAWILSEAGAAVSLVDVNEDLAVSAAEEIIAKGGKAFAIGADISQEDQVQRAVDATVGRLGRLDIVVANAAIQRHDRDVPVDRESLDAWDETQDVNLRGAFLTCRAGIRQMLKQGAGGSLVIVSSIAGLGGNSANTSYAVSKGGLISLGRVIAVNYARHGIRCNVVCPGALVRTPNHDIHPDPDGRAQRLTAKIPLGRPGEHAEIAPTIAFLASSASSYTTGAVVVVDGGLTVA